MKSIFLPPNHFALVDDEDFEAAKAVGNWTYSGGAGNSGGYACHWYTDSSGKRRRLWLHRFIAERMFGLIPKGIQIDHISGGQIGKKARLDNRRENLRLANRSSQQANKGPQINSSSGCKGINFRLGKYDVRLRYYGRRLCLGRYNDLYTAMTVYGFAHRLLWSEFSTETNVPDPTPELQGYVMSRLKQFGVEVGDTQISR